jgi:hypothetical protein
LSKKRRASKFEAKHRQLLEEEGQAFRQHQTPPPGDGKKGGVVPALLTIPTPDTKWYEDSTSLPVRSEVTTPSASKVVGSRRVKFEAEAIVLNVALEGELDLLKECMRKVTMATTNQYSHTLLACLSSVPRSVSVPWAHLYSMQLGVVVSIPCSWVGVTIATIKVQHVCTMLCVLVAWTA